MAGAHRQDPIEECRDDPAGKWQFVDARDAAGNQAGFQAMGIMSTARQPPLNRTM
jgi:hypothetical protein